MRSAVTISKDNRKQSCLLRQAQNHVYCLNSDSNQTDTTEQKLSYD